MDGINNTDIIGLQRKQRVISPKICLLVKYTYRAFNVILYIFGVLSIFYVVTPILHYIYYYNY